jgi:mitochondrial import receptor subunit TOM40
VSALLEQRFAPSFAFTVAGEIDHFKVRVVFLDPFH